MLAELLGVVRINQGELEQRAGLPKSRYANLKSGRGKPLHREEATKIAGAVRSAIVDEVRTKAARRVRRQAEQMQDLADSLQP